MAGAGNLGAALSARLAGAGHAIMFGSGAAAKEVAGGSACLQVRARTAAGFGDVVALAVPFSAIDAALEQAGPLAGKVPSSCVSALKPGHLRLTVGFESSAA